VSRLPWALVPVAAALLCWTPILGNYFAYDDFLHLYDVVTLGLFDFATQVWGGHVYVARNLVFRAMFEVFGPNPRPFFWSVLLTHGLNALLLYRVIRRFSGDVALACFGATLWATCSILEGTLGWYAVYGQVLLTTVVLGVLWSLGNRQERPAPLRMGTALAWTVLLAIGSTCFGMGLGIAAVFPLVVVLALPRAQLPLRSLIVLVSGAIVTVVGYALVLSYSSSIGSAERALLAPRAVVRALPTVLALGVHLIGFAAAALLLSVVGRQEPLPSWTQAAGALGLLLLLAIGWRYASAPRRRVLIALAMTIVAAYGTVAAGRVNAFNLVGLPAAAAATAPRYHYLPLALLTVLVCTVLGQLTARRQASSRIMYGALALWMLARTVTLVTHPLAIEHWDGPRAETEAALASIREQVARTPPGTTVRIDDRPLQWLQVLSLLLSRGTQTFDFPGWAGLFVIFSPENSVAGHPVRFLVSEQEWRRAQARGGRIAELVEPRADSPSSSTQATERPDS